MSDANVQKISDEILARILPEVTRAVKTAASEAIRDVVGVATKAVADAAVEMTAKVLSAELIDAVRDDVISALETEQKMTEITRLPADLPAEKSPSQVFLFGQDDRTIAKKVSSMPLFSKQPKMSEREEIYEDLHATCEDLLKDDPDDPAPVDWKKQLKEMNFEL